MQIYVKTFNVATYLLFFTLKLKKTVKGLLIKTFFMKVENNFSKNKKWTTICRLK